MNVHNLRAVHLFLMISNNLYITSVFEPPYIPSLRRGTIKSAIRPTRKKHTVNGIIKVYVKLHKLGYVRSMYDELEGKVEVHARDTKRPSIPLYLNIGLYFVSSQSVPCTLRSPRYTKNSQNIDAYVILTQN